jgi:dTDP-4-dehydrorhamnose 3,5-epimerase-like enzyme
MQENSKIINLPSNIDERGVLTSIESQMDIPIDIKRIFYMHDIKNDRGGHAHRNTDQVLIPVSGSILVSLSDGNETRKFKMNDATKGLYIPRMTFTAMSDFSEGAVCLVLANTHYDMSKSIRTWEEFLDEINQLNADANE